MTRLVLHVGTHKTGTTSIQSALAQSRNNFRQTDIYYPDISAYFGGRRDAHHEFAHCLARDDKASNARIQRFVSHLEDAAKRHDTIVLSAEPFYRHCLPNPAPKPRGETRNEAQCAARDAYVAKLASVFAGWDPEISIYFRNPLDFAESLFANAVVNSSNTAAFSEYIDRKWIRFDYRFQLDTFRKHFSRVRVFSYEEKARRDLVESFFADHGLGVPAVAPAHLRSSAAKPAVLWILRAKQAREMSIREVRERWHFALLKANGPLFEEPGRSTFWVSGEDRDRFLRLYGEPFDEIDFAPPGAMPPAVFWNETRQRAAESAFLAWREKSREYLDTRHRLGLPAYILDESIKAPVLTEREVVVAKRAQQHLTAAICVATRNRKGMLRDLLNSFTRLEMPGEVTPVFIIVENNDQEKMIGVVDDFRRRMAGTTVNYVLEHDIGIPIARNTAVEHALLAGADVILFVDDDEVVAEDWLDRLIQRYRTTDLLLIGGPVRPTFSMLRPSAWQKGIARGIEERYNAKIDKANARFRKGKQSKITIITNNWLGDSKLFTKYRLEFNPKMRFSGGSDCRFYEDATDRGIATGWCPDAFVFETVPQGRLSVAYQFYRGMEQSRTSFASKMRKSGFGVALGSLVVMLIVRICGMAILALLLPFFGSRAAVKLARSAGWVTGRVTGLFGAKSALYEKTTGF